MYEFYKRMQEKHDEDRKLVVLYLGDHDPSGLDMVRDMKERLVEMLLGGVEYGKYYKGDADELIGRFELPLEVRHVALTSDQIHQYKPPPNPAKITDPRARDYIAKYGRVSWEVDALRPEIMMQIVDDAAKEYIDIDKMNAIIKKEKKDMTKLEKFAKTLVK
jgi:hypothetical protein